jgi:hypothetical protein
MRSTIPALILLIAPFVVAGDAAGARPAGQVTAGQTAITVPDSSAWSPAARRILELEIERSAAIARQDTAWLSGLYASDFSGVTAGGFAVDQAALMRVFSRDNPESRFAIDELVVRDFGTAATVMGRLRTMTSAGNLVGESRYLHVYLLRDQRWWIVAAAGSAVQQAAAPRER